MNVVLDACSIINLINGNILHKIIAIPGYLFHVGDILLDQEILNQSQKLILLTCIKNNSIDLIESTTTLSEFNRLKQLYNLGTGETECIAICKANGNTISTDDLKARKAAVIELGDEQKVIGSLFLLRTLVVSKSITASEAYSCYLLMKQKGGFLPRIAQSFFDC